MQDHRTEGRFDQIRGKIRATWGEITDDDITEARGNFEALIGKIKERTGDTVETIRHRLDNFMKRGEGDMG